MALIIEDEYLQEMNLSSEALRLEIAILLYQQQRLSLGKASKLAGLNQILFQKEMGKRKVEVNYDADEFARDLKTLGIS